MDSPGASGLDLGSSIRQGLSAGVIPGAAAITSFSHLVISSVRELIHGGLVLNAQRASADVVYRSEQLRYVAHDATKR